MPSGLPMRFRLAILGTRGQCRRAVDGEIAIVAEPHFQPRQGRGSWTGDGSSVATECAAVAGTGDNARIRLPRREAPEVGAHRTQRIETFLSSHHENAEAGIERNRSDRVTLGPAYADDRRGLVKHVR